MKDRASQAREVFRGSRALEYGHVEIRPSVPEMLAYCEALDSFKYYQLCYIFLFSARANFQYLNDRRNHERWSCEPATICVNEVLPYS